MNNTLRIAGLSLLLSGCIITSPGTGVSGGALPACTAKDTEFEKARFDEWPDAYHKKVSKVIEAHIKTLQSINTEQLTCTSDDYSGLTKPTPALRELAESLPPWKDEEALNKLSEADIGTVLLEYLRIYECSLNERRNNVLALRVQKESASEGSSTGLLTDRGEIDTEKELQENIIERELLIAKPTLERTLTVIGGQDRLRPLSVTIECLKRASLDMRNVLGLNAQVAACMPRARDARGSLRDLAD